MDTGSNMFCFYSDTQIYICIYNILITGIKVSLHIYFYQLQCIVFYFMFVFCVLKMLASTFRIGFMTFLIWVQTLLHHPHLAESPRGKAEEHTLGPSIGSAPSAQAWALARAPAPSQVIMSTLWGFTNHENVSTKNWRTSTALPAIGANKVGRTGFHRHNNSWLIFATALNALHESWRRVTVIPI